MSRILDTDGCSFALRGQLWVRIALFSKPLAQLHVSTITIAEAWAGSLKSPNRDRLIALWHAFLEPCVERPVAAVLVGHPQCRGAQPRAGAQGGELDEGVIPGREQRHGGRPFAGVLGCARGFMGFLTRVRLAASASVLASVVAASAGAADDPGKEGPRLQYARGPGECLSETDFRREVAIAGDGDDPFGAKGTDVLRVWFEKLPGGRYRGTVQYTDGAGQGQDSKVEVYTNCEVLGRWVAVDAYYALPRATRPVEPVPQPVDAVPPERRTWSPPPLPPQRFTPPVPPVLPSPLCDFLRLLRRMDLTIGLSGLVLMSAGFTANVGPGFGVGVDVRGDVFSFGVELRGLLPSKAYAREPIDPMSVSTPQELDVSVVSALLVPCARWKYLVSCAVGQVGAMFFAAGAGTVTNVVFNVGPRLGVEVPFAERFAVVGFGEVLFAAVQNRATFSQPPVDAPEQDPGNVKWVQPIAAGFFGAGLSVKFQ